MKRDLGRQLVFALAIVGCQPAMAESVNVTGANGGTIHSDRNCAREEGQATCTTTGPLTGANVSTATRTRKRVTGNGSSATTITSTGPEGKSRSWAHLLTVTR